MVNDIKGVIIPIWGNCARYAPQKFPNAPNFLFRGGRKMKTKKMFSKVLAVALSVLMLVGMIPVFASAAENEAAPAA